MMGWLLFLFLLFAPPSHFSAYWDSQNSALITWTQSTRSCLSVEHASGERVFIECREKAGVHRVYLGHAGGLDAKYRPTAGDVFVLSNTTGELARAPLVGRPVYVAVIRA